MGSCKNRCFCCRKKISAVMLKCCKCGGSFCSNHLFPESHDCSKIKGEDRKAEQTYGIKAEKIKKI